MQQHGALAYQQTAKTVESPREREAILLIKAAASLQNIRDTWPPDLDQLSKALTFNRKLWTIFMSSATSPENPLPHQTRQNIVNLGMYVLNETREIMLQPVAPKLDSIISINRQIAAGLRASA